MYHGDCREVMEHLEPVQVVITDPPYGDTSLRWDRQVYGWMDWVEDLLIPSGSVWVFGSFRFFFGNSSEFKQWKFAQDVVWEKHNGSSFHADRFKRVHEHAVQFYQGSWGQIYKNPVKTLDAVDRAVRRKKRPTHMGHIEAGSYVSHDGGPRLMRSVIYARSCHGNAEHPTQKPVEVIDPLLGYSCPPDGIVLDPFAGSGSTLAAARALGLTAIGIEIDERYCEIAAKRLDRMVA